jgi:Protein of unknown function (DUF3592)
MYSNTRRRDFQLFAWAVRVLYMVPMAVAYMVVHLVRRMRRWYLASRAESWSKVTALVSGSYEIDENQSVLSRNGWGLEEDDYEYYPRFAIALEYSYQADGERYAGVYFLPQTYSEGDLAGEAEQAWAGRKIIVRYNPDKPAQSAFLEEDGAPGKPHIPRLVSYRRYLTDLSLK